MRLTAPLPSAVVVVALACCAPSSSQPRAVAPAVTDEAQACTDVCTKYRELGCAAGNDSRRLHSRCEDRCAAAMPLDDLRPPVACIRAATSVGELSKCGERC
jgi:hypothetical protein